MLCHSQYRPLDGSVVTAEVELCELAPCSTAHRAKCRDSGVSERDFISEVLIAWPFRSARGLSPPSSPSTSSYRRWRKQHGTRTNAAATK